LNDPSNHIFRIWLQHELDPRCNADPTSTTVPVPTQDANESTSDYVGCLRTLGLVVTEWTVAPWAVETAKPGGAILAVEHSGERVSNGSKVDVAENPTTVPSWTPGPRDTDEDDEPCGLGSPKGSDPGPGQDPFSAYLGSYTNLNDPLNFQTLDAGPTYLLWGTTTGPDYGGWGFRHIYASHGFGPADIIATRTTLTAALPQRSIAPGAVDRWVYEGLDLYWGSDGRPCKRVVVVERDKIDDNQAPAQTGIWTSYGKDATSD
jgi:hypothetical protein